MKDKVFLKKCSTYEKVEPIVFSLLDKYKPKLKKKAKILLKPNFLYAAPPEKGVSPHPTVMAAVAKWCRKNFPESIIYLGDSSGVFGVPAFNQCIKELNVTPIAKKYDIKIRPFDTQERVLVNNPKNVMWKDLEFPDIVVDADFIINICKLKTHVLTLFTGAVKNMYGCIVGKTKGKGHVDGYTNVRFGNLLVDVCTTAKPNISIMDAVVGMEGQGPGRGDPVKIGYVIASDNPFAVDHAALKLVSLDEKTIYTQIQGRERKFFDKVEIIGDYKPITIKAVEPSPMIMTNAIPEFLSMFSRLIRRLSFEAFQKIPIINEKDCVKCYDCVKACPVQTIKIKKDKFPKVIHKECIGCFMCVEHCKYKSIDLKQTRMGRIVKYVKTHWLKN